MSKRIASAGLRRRHQSSGSSTPRPGRAGQREIAAVISSNPGAYALSGPPGPASPAMWWPGRSFPPARP